MKKLMLFMAGIAMSLGTHAQFSLDAGICGIGYRQPCSSPAGYAYNSSSLTDAVISDVHGALNSSSLYHYEVGDFDNSGDRDIYLIKKNRSTGATVSTLTFDANTAINSNPATDDNCKKMTVDENNQKAYITGKWGPASIPFIACINLTTNAFSWGKSLNTYADINDVCIDASGNVYALVSNFRSCNTCPDEFSILKYSSSSTFLGSWSTSSIGSPDSYYGTAIEYDGSGKIFISGGSIISSTSSLASLLFGINTNMTLNSLASQTSYPFNSGFFLKIGRNPTNGHIFTAGYYAGSGGINSTTWQEWDVISNPSKYTPLSPTTTPTGLSGISTTLDELLTDLLVDPNGKVDILIANLTLGYRYLTYINPALNSGAGDIDYSTGGGNAFQFPSTGPVGILANKDEDGSIIVGGVDGTLSFTAKFHDASLTTGTGAWPGYENKSTGINHIHADDISIAPNPASDVLSIEGINDNADYRISNTLGQVVTKGNLSNSKNAQINISGLNQGTYYLQLYSADKSIITTKPFVKQ